MPMTKPTRRMTSRIFLLLSLLLVGAVVVLPAGATSHTTVELPDVLLDPLGSGTMDVMVNGVDDADGLGAFDFVAKPAGSLPRTALSCCSNRDSRFSGTATYWSPARLYSPARSFPMTSRCRSAKPTTGLRFASVDGRSSWQSRKTPDSPTSIIMFHVSPTRLRRFGCPSPSPMPSS